MIQLNNGKLNLNNFVLKSNDLELKIEYNNDDNFYVLIYNNIRYALQKENGFLVWNIPDFDNDSIKIRLEVKKSNLVLFETNSILIKKPIYDDDFDIKEISADNPYINIKNKCILMPINIQRVLADENNSGILPFEIDRFDNYVDLSTKEIMINALNGIGEIVTAVVVNVSNTIDKLRFNWVLTEEITAHVGKVSFEVVFIGVDNENKPYLMRTKSSSFQIDQKLSQEGYIVSEYPKIISDIYTKIEDLIDAINNISISGGGEGRSFKLNPLHLNSESTDILDLDRIDPSLISRIATVETEINGLSELQDDILYELGK